VKPGVLEKYIFPTAKSCFFETQQKKTKFFSGALKSELFETFKYNSIYSKIYSKTGILQQYYTKTLGGQ